MAHLVGNASGTVVANSEFSIGAAVGDYIEIDAATQEYNPSGVVVLLRSSTREFSSVIMRNSGVRVRAESGTNDYFGTGFTLPTVGQRFLLRMVRVTSGFEVIMDGSSIGSLASAGNTLIVDMFSGNGAGSDDGFFDLYGVRVSTDGGATETNYYDPSAALPNGSVLPDTTGSNDAILAGHPTDGSQWVGAVGGTPNAAPVANAGADQPSVAQGSTVTLDASGSTDDVGISSYAWVQTSGTSVTLSNAAIASPTFTAPAVEETLTFEVTVEDAGALTSTDTVNIGIAAAANAAPVANAGADQAGITQGATVTLDATGSTDDVGISSYSWTQTVGTTVTLSNTAVAQPTFTAPSAEETLTFQVEVTDAGALTSTDTVNISIAAANAYNGANAGGNISALEGVVCQLDGTASLNVEGTDYPDSWAWTQTGGPAVTLTDADKPRPTFTAPAAPESLTFSLVVTDNTAAQTGTSVADTAVVTIVTAAGLPVANAGSDVTNVSTGAVVALDGTSSTDGTGIASYWWKQISGAYAAMDNPLSATPSFTAPAVSNRSAFAQDTYGALALSTPSSINIPTALSKLVDVTYAGAFRANVDSPSQADFNSLYAIGTIGYNPVNNSLYMAGNGNGGVGILAEFAIPVTLSTGTDIAAMPTAALLQDYVDVLGNDYTVGNPSDTINGMLVFNGNLLVSSEIFYNASGTHVDNLQVFSDSDNIATGASKGMLQFEGAAHVAGWMDVVPANMQTALGGTHVAGWANNYSINGRYSHGNSLFVFDPQDAVNADINGNRLIPTTPIIDYTSANPADPLWEALDIPASPIHNHVSRGWGGFILPNTNLFIVLGRNGGMNGGVGYKIFQENNTLAGGYANKLSTDVSNYFWIYDVDAALAQTNPYDAVPLAFGRWSHPFDDGNINMISGAAYDASIGRLYLTVDGAGQAGNFDYQPLVIAYDFAAKAQEVSAIGNDLTDMVFELEVTSVNGLKSTDTKTVSLASSADTTAPVITINPTTLTYNLTVGDAFSTPVGTSTDNVDAPQTVTPTGTVDVNTVGNYTLTYSDSDAAGNVATPVVVTVNVSAPQVVTVNFIGNINNRAIAVNGPLSINVAGSFAGTETPFTYSLLSGTLPTGLSLNTSTGVISGTPTVLGLSSGIVMRATDTGANTADTNSFDIDVVDGVVIPEGDRLTQAGVARYLRTQGFTGANNDVIMSWLRSEGFELQYNDTFNAYLGSLGYTGSYADRLSAWRKGVGV
ncbi:putative Ig domain-containing protein [Flavobacteriaceae bacterium]|nr:putative Ig domain-containing protein [Flavobacteriaceae bacterium]